MKISIYRKNIQFKKFSVIFFYCRSASAVLKWLLIFRQKMRRNIMKYVKEIVIIFGITMVGELLNKFIPLPVPAGVYGLFILLGGLCSGIIKVSDVEVTGNLLLDLMPVMFIPAAVGIIDKIEELKAVMIPMLIITFVTTFIVMSITGVTAEWIIKRQKKGAK